MSAVHRNNHKQVSDAQFRKDVAATIASVDGVWSPDTSKLDKIERKDLNRTLRAVYDDLKSSGTPDVYTTKVDGRSVFFMTAFDTDVGAAMSVLRDAKGRKL